VPGQSLAIIAESLYLINLLVLPGFAFLVLMWLYLKYENYSELAGCHLRQAFSASIWVWVIVILYFTICHSTLVILGIIALVKAMAGQMFHYPIIGPSH